MPESIVLSTEFETEFYTTNNLPEQLKKIFKPINPARIDEDILESLCERAVSLIRNSYLLDDQVQFFYRALEEKNLLNQQVVVGRAEQKVREKVLALVPGTAVLMAVKRLWAQDWNFEAVLERLDKQGSVALEARLTYIVSCG